MKYTYNFFREDLDRILGEIVDSGVQYEYVVGVVRGGAIPAVCLSHQLNIPMKCVSWSTYHRDQMKESAMDIAEDIQNGKKVLVVDDILDSGRTISELLEDWDVERNQIDLAVLVWNISQDINPDFVGRTIDRETNKDWVTFWWEAADE